MASRFLGTLDLVFELGQPALAWFASGLVMGQLSILRSDFETAEKTSESSFLFWKLALVSL